jgi:hypothetical protein
VTEAPAAEAELQRGEAQAEDGTDRRRRADRRALYAFLAFAAVVATAIPLILVFGRYLWFPYDDWKFLVGRTAGDLGDLLRPQNDHWATLPILAFRLLWWLVGVRSYVPYQMVVVMLHLTAAVLLRAVMRRAGVGPWISTAAASLFALFGAGFDNIIWATNMTAVGSLVFGLTHLLLADHDGPVDRRDWLGVLAGLAGLLCSGVAVTMTVVVGLAMLVRRGWRIAALHTAPLGVLYLVWWAAVGRKGYTGAGIPSIGRLAWYVRTGIGATFSAMGQLPGAGVALGVLLVVGLVVAWGRLDGAERRRRAAAPGALLIGAVLFLVIAGLGRAKPPTGAVRLFPAPVAPSRYLHMVAALTVPALAVAADAVVRRWRLLGPAVLVLLVIGIPGNVKELADLGRNQTWRAYRQFILSLPRLPVAHEVPRWVRPAQTGFLPPEITIGWLLDGVASGRVPPPGPIDPIDAATWTLRLALYQSRSPTNNACENLAEPAMRRLDKGQSIGVEGGAVRVSYVPEGSHESRPILFNPANGRTLVALAGPLNLRLSSNNPATPAVLCDGGGDQPRNLRPHGS